MTTENKALNALEGMEPREFIFTNQYTDRRETLIQKSHADKLEKALRVAIQKLEYIESARGRRCQGDGCTCTYDTAYMGREEITRILEGNADKHTEK